MRAYITEWNGLSYYLVTCQGKGADLVVNVHDDAHGQDYGHWRWAYKPKYTFAPQRVFIGDNDNNASIFATYGDSLAGNSILLEFTDYRYVFIGKFICSFQTTSPIVEFWSPFGNNDVSYPYAIDAGGTYYALEERVTVTGFAGYGRDLYALCYGGLDDKDCSFQIMKVHIIEDLEHKRVSEGPDPFGIDAHIERKATMYPPQ